MTGLTDVHLDCDACFSFKIKATIAAQTLEVTSNCFKVACDDCYTSVLEYTNDNNYAEFYYCDGYPVNKARLYLHLFNPKSIEDKAVYRKSNGVIRQTRSLITKEYLAETEFFPEHIHDKIAVALAHDYITINSNNYIGGISKSGEYDIDWIDKMCLAPAKFKALATPFAIRNNNCAECGQVVLNPVCGEISDLIGGSFSNGSTWRVELTGVAYGVPLATGTTQFIEIQVQDPVAGWVLVGTIECDSFGTITNTNPFVITPIDNSNLSIPVKAINSCNQIEFIEVFQKP